MKFQLKYRFNDELAWTGDTSIFKNFEDIIVKTVRGPIVEIQEGLFELCEKSEINACVVITKNGSMLIHAKSENFSGNLKPIIDYVLYFIKGHKILRRGQQNELFLDDDLGRLFVFHIISDIFFIILCEKKALYATLRYIINPFLNKLKSAFKRVSPDFFYGLHTRDTIESFVEWAKQTEPFSSLKLDMYDVRFEPLIPHEDRFIHFDAILQYGEKLIFLRIARGEFPVSNKDVEQFVFDIKSVLEDRKLVMAILFSSKGVSKDAIEATRKLPMPSGELFKFITFVTVENEKFKLLTYEKLAFF